jgi:UDP-N-acetyl-D-mannosaminuronic acid dehydrogenase
VDPWFVVQAAPESARLISLAREVNDGMPAHVVDLVRSAVGRLEGAVIVALGRTYKADVTDERESPAIRVIDALRRAGVEVREHDAMVLHADTVEALASGADGLVYLVDHTAYRNLEPAQLASRMRRPVVVDTRGAIDRTKWERAGFAVTTLGRGGPEPRMV